MFEYPSSRCCFVFELVVVVFFICFSPASATLASQRISIFESPASCLTGQVFDYPSSRYCSVFELVAFIISIKFSTLADTLACQCLSIFESPASDLTGRVFEYTSSRCCYVFELWAIVISLGLPLPDVVMSLNYGLLSSLCDFPL